MKEGPCALSPNLGAKQQEPAEAPPTPLPPRPGLVPGERVGLGGVDAPGKWPRPGVPPAARRDLRTSARLRSQQGWGGGTFWPKSTPSGLFRSRLQSRPPAP